jgi:hypothetical protein
LACESQNFENHCLGDYIYGADMHEGERVRVTVTETEIYEWMDEGWVSDLDTAGIFFVSDHKMF